MQVLVIGIDGATWSILDRLISEGYTPNIAEVTREGVRSKLVSLIPPVTGAAWLAIATGLHPGQTGVIDFFKRTSRDNYKVKAISSEDYKGRAIWDLASVVGLSATVHNYPMLYPPYPINGYMVTGMGTPDVHPSTYPQQLKKELKNIGGLYPIYVEYHEPKYNDLDIFAKDIRKHLRMYAKSVQHLVAKDTDIYITVVQASDWMQHRLWAYIDPSHPYYEKINVNERNRGKQIFLELWQIIDEIIGKLIDTVKGNPDIFIISDHGFGPQYGVLNLARWLVKNNYMKVKTRVKYPIRLIISKIARNVYRVLLPLGLGKIREKVSWLVSSPIFDIVDIRSSKAICLNHTIPFGAIYVVAENNKEDIIESLVKDLRKLEKQIGRTINIYKIQQLYPGPFSELLPDIIIIVDDGAVVVKEDSLTQPLYVSDPYSVRHTGSHRLDGVFIAFGSSMQTGKILNYEVSVLDIVPTLLCRLNLPIPKDIKGRVVKNIYKSNGRAFMEPKYVPRNYYIKIRLRNRLNNLKKMKDHERM